MRAYRWSVRLKLGLIVFAVVIALASLAYTQRLVERLREREQAVIQLWADAQAQVASAQRRSFNPYRAELRRLEGYLQQAAGPGAPPLSAAEAQAYRRAVDWAQTMPQTGELNFILNEILEPNPFSIPAIITDSLEQRPLFWRNVGVPDSLTTLSPADSAEALERLRKLRAEMDATFEPIPIRIQFAEEGGQGATLTQYVHYDESSLVTELRVYPWIQLLFVGLFVVVGYLGFSYVRRSEQSNLWVGMAREAAHQLGTPISSLMGWLEVLRSTDDPDSRAEALDEIENDVERLRRVASRFSDIGSMPKVETQDVAAILEQSAAYIQRRIPQRSQRVTLDVDLERPLRAPVNEELFAWVVENLLKNALDAIESEEGRIEVRGRRENGTVAIEVRDTGCGIERREWKNVFRPGYSTKKRGWGLGLSLAQRVVEDYHGGSIVLADSTVGGGSTFRVDLPEA
jgi:hypothetical protein